MSEQADQQTTVTGTSTKSTSAGTEYDQKRRVRVLPRIEAVPGIVAVIPMLCTLIVMAVLTLILQSFFTCPPSRELCTSIVDTALGFLKPPTEVPTIPPELARTSGLLSWTIWSLIYFFVLVAALVMSCLVLAKELRQNGKQIGELSKVLVGLVVLLGLITWFILNRPGIHSLTIGSFVYILDTNHAYDPLKAADVVGWLKFFSYLIAGWLVIAGAVVLYVAKNTAARTTAVSDSAKAKLQDLAKRQQHIQLLLYSAALLLAVGVIHMQSTYAWALSYLIIDADTLKETLAFTSTLTTYAGLSASALLAAAYLPTAAIISEIAQSYTSDPKLLEEYNLNFSLQGFLVRAATILAPLLTVPLSGIVEQIFGIG